MKKLMTMIAAVATAFGLYAAEGDIDAFDAATGSLTDGQWTLNNEVITGEIPEAAITDSKLVFQTNGKAVGRNFAKGDESGFVPVEFTEPVYLDTYINFQEPCSEVQTIPAGTKIAAYVLDNSELLEEQGATAVGPSTNLYAIAAYWNGEAWEQRAFMFDTPEAVTSKLEQRLTAKVYPNVLASGTRMGFRFFLNGVDGTIKTALKVKCVFPIEEGVIDFNDPIFATDASTPYLGCEASALNAEVRGRATATDRSLVISLASTEGAVSALDFVGKGALGSLLLTANKPSFIDDDASTMAVTTEGVASVTVTGADYKDGVITFAAGTTSIGVTATYNTGCTIVKWTYQGGDVTPDPVTAEQTITPVKNATLNIRAVAPAAYVIADDGTMIPFENFFEDEAGNQGALDYVNVNGGTLKLTADVTADPENSQAIAFDSESEIVLDLAGKTIKGSDPTDASITVADGTTLTITNSTDTIGSIAKPYGSDGETTYEGDNSIDSEGTLVIAGGIMAGKVMVAESATITGGTFEDAIEPDEDDILTTTGGLFNKGVFETEEDIPGVPEEGYTVVAGPEGYWTVVAVTGFTATFMNGEDVWETQEKVTQATEPETDPTKADYNFMGWALEGTTELVTFPYTLTADTTFDAVFEAKDYVAKIGDDQFETFEEAVAALKEDGQTIELIKEATLTTAVTPAFSTTFDMGGFTLNAKLQKAITCAAGKTLNVTNGTIAISHGSYTIEVYGTLNVLNGARIEKDNTSGPVFDVYDTATINVEDGAYLSNGGVNQVFRFDEYDTSNCTYTVNVKGGTIDAGTAKVFDVYKPGATATITISGGTINAGTLLNIGANNASKDSATAYLTITDGTINATTDNFSVLNDSTLNCTLDGTCAAKFKVDQGLNDYCADGYKAKLNGEWYEIAAIQYATYKVTTDEGVASYVVSNGTAEVEADAQFDIDDNVTLTVYPTLKADYELVTDECVLSAALTEAKEYELKVVTKAAAAPDPVDGNLTEDGRTNLATLKTVLGATDINTWAAKIYDNGLIPAEKLNTTTEDLIAISVKYDLPILGATPTIEIAAATDGAFTFQIKDAGTAIELKQAATDKILSMVEFTDDLATTEFAPQTTEANVTVALKEDDTTTATVEFTKETDAGFMRVNLTK